MTKLSIIIPFYNEIDNSCKLEFDFYPTIQKLIFDSQLNSNHFNRIEIIFVDDGSVDGSLDEFTKISAKFPNPEISTLFVKHTKNQGLGAALRSGFAVATGDIVVTTDIDGTYKFDEIPNLLSYLIPDVDIVTASPYHPDGQVIGVPAYRLILSRASSMFYQLLVNRRIHTYTSLFRAYRHEVIKQIHFDANGFLGGTELLVKAIFNGYKVQEYPAILYRRTYGSSKAKLVKTTIAHLEFLNKIFFFKLRLRSF